MSEKKKRRILAEPRKIHEQLEDRKVSWLELFHDLIYVVIIAQLTHHLAGHISTHNILFFFMLFVPIYWAWANATYYHDLHGKDDFTTRYLTFLQMMAACGLAVSIGEVFEGHFQDFAILYAFHMSIITFLWWRTGYFDEEQKPVAKVYVGFYLVSIALFIASVFVSFNIAMVLWGVALVISFISPVFARPAFQRRLEAAQVELRPSGAMMERFGLFTIIVLGETIVGIISGLQEHHHGTLELLQLLVPGVLFSFIMWGLYFDIFSDRKVRNSTTLNYIWTYFHLPVWAGIAIVGAGLANAIHGSDHHDIHTGRWLISGGLALAFLSFILLLNILELKEEELETKRKLIMGLSLSAIATILLSVLGGHLPSSVFLWLIVIVLGIPLVFARRFSLFTKKEN